MPVLRVFIGYDAREPVAYHVLAHSILRRASAPVSITPIMRSQLTGIYTRPRGALESTEFSLSRFLVPYLCRYTGHALFLDCDILCRADVCGLMHRLVPPTTAHHLVTGPDGKTLCTTCEAEPAVWVVKHDYTPKAERKFLGQPQTVYPRKNWSSVMLFNNRKCRALTRDYVNTAPGLDLHRFQWLAETQIGALAPEWNWLVGEYAPNPEAKLLHYTLGGPWFAAYQDCDHAEEWLAERAHMEGDPCPA